MPEDQEAKETVNEEEKTESPEKIHHELEETVTIPKSQIDLLYAQINSLAISVAEKDKQSRTAAAASATPNVPLKQSIGSSSSSLVKSSSTTSTTSERSTKPLIQLKSLDVERKQRPMDHGTGSTLMPEDLRALLDALPVYTGSVGECFKWWTQQVESFCKTFNIKINQIEYYMPHQLLKGKALERYREVQREYNNNKHTHPSSISSTSTSNASGNNRHRRPLPWKILNRELSKLDNPILRSIYIHEQVSLLRSGTNLGAGPNIDENSVMTLVTKFRKLEAQLDPAPLGDRLYLIFQVLPESRQMILDKIIRISNNNPNTNKPNNINKTNSDDNDDCIFNNVDELCDFILIHLDELMKSINKATTTNSSTLPYITTNAASTEHSNPSSATVLPLYSSSTSTSPTSGSPTSDMANNSLTILCNYCNKPGHLANKCFKRKKQRQKEKIKLYDSLQQQQAHNNSNTEETTTT